MASSWIITPTDAQLRAKENWKQLPAHQQAIIRFHLLLVRETGSTIKNGPVVSVQDRIPGTKFTETHRVKNIANRSEQIEQTIAASMSRQVSTEVMSKVGGSLSVSKDFSAALSSEIQEKELESLTHTIQEGLKSVHSFTRTIETEATNSAEQTVPETEDTSDSVTYTTFYKLREHVWSIYLMQTDYMHLTFRGYAIPWFDSRVILTEKSKQARKPLFRIRFYEPLPELSLTHKLYIPEVKDEKEIILRVFSGPTPSKTIPPHTSLLELAKEAFAANVEEREKVKRRKKISKAKTAGSTGRSAVTSRGHTAAKRSAGSRLRTAKKKKIRKSVIKAHNVVKKTAKKSNQKPVKKAASEKFNLRKLAVKKAVNVKAVTKNKKSVNIKRAGKAAKRK